MCRHNACSIAMESHLLLGLSLQDPEISRAKYRPGLINITALAGGLTVVRPR